MALSQKIALHYIRTKFRLLSSLSKTRAAQQAFDLFCTPQHRNKKPLPPVFKKGELLKMDFQNYHVVGYRWNAGAAKKVLILHGFESSMVNFDRYVMPLIRKDFEVLAFDAPAHGRSSGRRFNALLYKEFIQTILKAHGPVQSFLAHSLGGLAICLALEEMPHDAATKVALIAPATETTSAVESYFRYIQLNKDLLPYFDKVIQAKSGHPYAWFSIARALQNIHATILWAHDKEDNMTPLSDVQPIMQQHHPNITFMITEGLGHRRIYRDNKVSKAVIDFL